MITAKQARNYAKSQTMIECYDRVESAIKDTARIGETRTQVNISLPILDDEIAKWVCNILIQNGYTVSLVKSTDKIQAKDYYTFMIRW